MNAHNSGWLKTGAEAKALVAAEDHKKIGVPPKGQVDTPETLAALPVWQRTATTLEAKHVYPTGGAILKDATVADKDLARVEGWKKILKEIDWHKHGFVSAFLRELIFWHHRSTSGRFNDKLQRFERWVVKSVEAFAAGTYKVPNPAYLAKDKNVPYELWSKTLNERMASRRSFFRIKGRLLEMGLIEAHSHFRFDPDLSIKATILLNKFKKGEIGPDEHLPEMVTALWVKPTEELSRIIFEPGYWETVRSKYAFVKKKGKPRGVHAASKSEASDMALTGPTTAKNGTSLPPTLSI